MITINVSLLQNPTSLGIRKEGAITKQLILKPTNDFCHGLLNKFIRYKQNFIFFLKKLRFIVPKTVFIHLVLYLINYLLKPSKKTLNEFY